MRKLEPRAFNYTHHIFPGFDGSHKEGRKNGSKLGNLEDLPYRRFTGKLPVKIILPVKNGKIWM